MEYLHQFLLVLWITLWLSLIAIPFAAVPAGAVMLGLTPQKRIWRIPASKIRAERKVPYFRLALLGGLTGEFVAVSTLFWSEWWDCKTRGISCYDGQGPILLGLTIPVMAVFGSLLAMAWTWLSIRFPSEILGASVMTYTGRFPRLNWVCGVFLVSVFWVVIEIVAFRVQSYPS
jgi:hypothetical protein